MKYLKKFESKDPIDVDMDIEEFKNLFKEKIKDHILIGLKKLSDDYGSTMTDYYGYYNVYESDDYGREQRHIMIVRAVNKFHARMKASIRTKNLEIATTGFYSAKEVNIKEEISKLEKLINNSQKRLEELKRIS
jgi:hypothetical protein